MAVKRKNLRTSMRLLIAIGLVQVMAGSIVANSPLAPAPDSADPMDIFTVTSGVYDGYMMSDSTRWLMTVGEPVAGTATSSHGTWAWSLFMNPGSAGPPCCQQRGDINDDGSGPDVSDLVALVGYMFSGNPYPGCDDAGYFAEADINGDGGQAPDISDLVYLVNYMFSGGPPPVPCP